VLRILIVAFMVLAFLTAGVVAGTASVNATSPFDAIRTQVSTALPGERPAATQAAAQSTPSAGDQKTPTSSKPIKIADGLVILSYRFIRSGLYRADSQDLGTWVVGEMQNKTDKVFGCPGSSVHAFGQRRQRRRND
jgi:uncharacterized iron-regulated membrane protein